MRRAMPFVRIVAAMAVVVAAWILGTPPSAGPDEPSHVVRSAAIVRGDFSRDLIAPTRYGFELPAHVAFPDPGCFAFQPEVPASCATALEPPSGDAILASASVEYPVWGYFAPGLGSFLPSGWSSTGARAADALLPLLLIGGALFAASRHGWSAAGGVLLALTVPVWFIIATVNPSGLVIAGGVGLWTALANGSRAGPRHGWQLSRVGAVLLAVSWAAMALPRRDGLIYATLVLAAGILIFDIGVGHLRRQVTKPVWAAIILSTTATLIWAAVSSTGSSRFLFACPFIPAAALLARRIWRVARARFGRTGEIGFAVIGVVVVLGTSLVVMSRRSGGFDGTVLQRSIGQTGIDLREAIGVVGWLDAAVPQSMVFLWLIALGMFVAASVIDVRRRAIFGAIGVLTVGVLASWVLTMVQNADGTYWQGRYYLPLLVGVPIVLSTASIDRAAFARLARVAGAISLVVLNVGFAAALRRWGVGQSGSMVPFRWDTYDTLMPPVVLLGLHATGTVALWRSVGSLAGPADDAVAAQGARPTQPGGVNLLGYHQSASGLGVAVRQLRASLEAAGVPVSVFEVDVTDSPRLNGPDSAAAGPIRSTTLAVVTAPELPAALAAHPELTSVDRVIAYWFWELDAVPDTHRIAYQLVDEVWAPTSFVADAYRRSIDVPPVVVQSMHLSRPLAEAERVATARRRLAPGDEFVFLVTLDLFSIVERKNPFAAIDAFALLDSVNDPPARLVIKTLNGDQRPAALQRIVDHVEASGVADRIEVVDDFVTGDDMVALLAAADCLVSLHRGEGLGLNLAEAMWLGTPVIATRWSGNLDFMDDANSLLVDAELVPVASGEGAYPDGMLWAESDIGQAAEAMRRLVHDPAFARSLSRRARGSMAMLPNSTRCGHAYAATLGSPVGMGVTAAPDFNDVLHELRTRRLAEMPAGAQRMLSVGCAGSWYFDWMEEAYGQVEEHVGIEFFSPEPENLPPFVTWIADTASNMESIADASADLLFSGQNIEHLWPDDVVGFLMEANRVVRTGGTVVVDSPNRLVTERLGWSQPEHTIEFTADEAVELMELAGFAVTLLDGLWDCSGSNRLEPVSSAEVAVRAKPVAVDDAFVWWVEAERVGPADRERLAHRVEAIFEHAWPERMSRRIINEQAVSTGDDNIGLPPGVAGVIVHGPHAPLSAGSYAAVFDISIDGDNGLDVGACLLQAGPTRLGAVDLVATGAAHTRRIEIPFELTEMTFGIHGRVDATGVGRLTAAPAIRFVPERPVGH